MIEPVHECVKADCAAALPLAPLTHCGKPVLFTILGNWDWMALLDRPSRRLRLGVKEVLQGCSPGSHLHGSPTIVVIFLLMRLINLRRHFASPIYIFFSPTHMAIGQPVVLITQNYGIGNTIKWNHEGSLSFDIVALTARRITFRSGS